MAKKRPPATTPFGAWLGEWLDDHDDWTVEAFAAEVGVSPAAVSQWLTKTKRIQVEHLREVARVTGEDFDLIWGMVYGRKVSSPPAGLSEELLDAIEERVRRAFREELQAAIRELRGELG